MAKEDFNVVVDLDTSGVVIITSVGDFFLNIYVYPLTKKITKIVNQKCVRFCYETQR